MNVIEVNSGNFKSEVLQSPVPVLLDAYSPTCGPCRAAAPILDELAQEVRGRARVVKANTAEDIYFAAALRITAYPTFVVFHDGQEVARFVGLRTKEKLKEALLGAAGSPSPGSPGGLPPKTGFSKPDYDLAPEEIERLVQGVDDHYFGGLREQCNPLAEDAEKKRGSD